MNTINKKIFIIGFLISARLLNALDVPNPIYLYKENFENTYTISSPGYYLITEDIEFSAASGHALVITTSHVTVDFNTHAIYNTGSGDDGIYAHDAGDITIKNGTISGFTDIGIYLVNVIGYTISNCTVMNSGIDGIFLQSCYDGRIIDCNSIQNNDIAGLSIQGLNTENLYVKNSHFDDNKNGSGVYVSAVGSNLIFEDCTFNNNTYAGVDGAWLSIFRNCTAANNGTSGFWLYEDVICESCTAFKNTGIGFYLEDGDDNQLKQCTSNNNALGIFIASLSNVLTECSCYNNTTYGIENNNATSIITGCIAGSNGTANYFGTTLAITTTINQLGDNDVPPISDYTNIDLV